MQSQSIINQLKISEDNNTFWPVDDTSEQSSELLSPTLEFEIIEGNQQQQQEGAAKEKAAQKRDTERKRHEASHMVKDIENLHKEILLTNDFSDEHKTRWCNTLVKFLEFHRQAEKRISKGSDFFDEFIGRVESIRSKFKQEETLIE